MVVQQWILVYCLQDGSRVNRLWLRLVSSFSPWLMAKAQAPKFFYFLTIWILITVCNSTHDGIICKLQRVKRALSMSRNAVMGGQLSVARVLSTRGGEGWLPVKTVWGLFVRKSSIHLWSVSLGPRVLALSLLISLRGKIVLNVELKSENSILMLVLLFSKYVKTEWRAVRMVSSVDLYGLNANWWGSRLCWRIVFDVQEN